MFLRTSGYAKNGEKNSGICGSVLTELLEQLTVMASHLVAVGSVRNTPQDDTEACAPNSLCKFAYAGAYWEDS